MDLINNKVTKGERKTGWKAKRKLRGNRGGSDHTQKKTRSTEMNWVTWVTGDSDNAIVKQKEGNKLKLRIWPWRLGLQASVPVHCRIQL